MQYGSEPSKKGATSSPGSAPIPDGAWFQTVNKNGGAGCDWWTRGAGVYFFLK
jgi:hypothetical protein